jgi:protein-arginine kinase activator protein McsA
MKGIPAPKRSERAFQPETNSTILLETVTAKVTLTNEFPDATVIRDEITAKETKTDSDTVTVTDNS